MVLKTSYLDLECDFKLVCVFTSATMCMQVSRLLMMVRFLVQTDRRQTCSKSRIGGPTEDQQVTVIKHVQTEIYRVKTADRCFIIKVIPSIYISDGSRLGSPTIIYIHGNSLNTSQI